MYEPHRTSERNSNGENFFYKTEEICIRQWKNIMRTANLEAIKRHKIGTVEEKKGEREANSRQ